MTRRTTSRLVRNRPAVRTNVTIPLAALSPGRLLVVGFCFWAAVRLSIFFIDYGVTTGFDAILTVAGYTFSFFIGTRLVRTVRDRSEPRAVVSSRTYRRVAVVLYGVAVMFLCLRVYDLLFVRGFLEAGSIAEFRILENTVIGDDRSTGGIGFISGVGYPIAIPVMLFALAYRRHLTRSLVVGGFLIAGLFAAYVLASGNRYVLLGPAMMAVILSVIVRGGIQMTLRGCVRVVIVLAIAFTYLTYGTLQRDLLYGAATSEQALEAAPDRKLFTASSKFMEVFRSLPTVVQDGLYGYIDVTWYITHGWYEYVKTLEFADPNDLAWGGAQFATGFYFLRTIGLDVSGEETWQRNLPTYGFYTTFFGPVYLDFGIGWGCVYCVVLGIMAQRLWLGALQRKSLGTLTYPFVASVLLNVMTNNLIVNGLGTPILAVTMVAAFIVGVAERMATTEFIPGVLSRVAPRPAAVDRPPAITGARHPREHWA